MCLYTKMVLNPKYKPNKKNKGVPPICEDERTKYIPVGCGNCIECRKKKQREWRVRMMEEIKHDKTGKFVTLTFSEESLKKLEKEAETKEANTVATLATRKFLERWRAKHKKSLKHWLITELGHKNTERIHMHGIIFTEETKEEIEARWGYGRIEIGYSMGERCVNYVMKYVLKTDKDHKGFIGKILVSPGIGKGYIKGFNAKRNKYNEKETDETYKLNNGAKIALPTYYRNKIYTDEEKERLWIEKLEKNEIYVMGRKIKKIDTEKGKIEMEAAINYAKKISKTMGYGTGEGKKMYMTRNFNKKDLEEERKIHTFTAMIEKAEQESKARINHIKNTNNLKKENYEKEFGTYEQNRERFNRDGRRISEQNENSNNEQR